MQTEIIAMPETEEWYEARKTGLGGTDAAAACGLSEYKTALDVYLEKTGGIEPQQDNTAMRLGRKLEPVVRSEFEYQTGLECEIAPCGMYRHPTHSFMIGTPDGILTNGEGLECKTATWRLASRLGDEGTDDLPPEWLCQIHHYMSILDIGLFHVAVLLDGRTLKTYQVARNDRLIERIVEAERELWERIEGREIPEPDWEHPRTPQLIRDMYGIAEGADPIELSEEAAIWWSRRKDISKNIKEMEAKSDDLKARVLYEIGHAAGGIIPGTGKMIRRKMVDRKGYIVEPKSFIDVREVNAPKPILRGD